MSERFFVDAAITTERATLRGAEAHHLLHVMRAKIGDEVQLFDGSGSQFTARVEQLSRSQAELLVLKEEAVDRESTVALTLAVAMPKGERQRWLVEKAVELGVTRIVPLSTKRSVAEISAATLDRLKRIVIEASKQCGRNRLLEISEPQNWQQAIESFAPNSLRILAHPGGSPLGASWSVAATGKASTGVIAAIGPEGGFSEEEVNSALAAGWIAVSLGPRILRVETAALAIAAWVTAESA